MNKIFLHLEGLAVLLISLYFYSHYEFSWLLFIILLFIPDLSMLGYVLNERVGAVIYNIFHTYALALLVVLGAMLITNDFFLSIGLIWIAHIGMDRLFGFGLKYKTDFKDTHLQRV